jgi:hypothetical protein
MSQRAKLPAAGTGRMQAEDDLRIFVPGWTFLPRDPAAIHLA